MTVAELIVLLLQVPQDARVIVRGYEGGYNDVSAVHKRPIKVDANDSEYFGSHDDPRENEPPDEFAYEVDAFEDAEAWAQAGVSDGP